MITLVIEYDPTLVENLSMEVASNVPALFASFCSAGIVADGHILEMEYVTALTLSSVLQNVKRVWICGYVHLNSSERRGL